jgi:hypothetical protein
MRPLDQGRFERAVMGLALCKNKWVGSTRAHPQSFTEPSSYIEGASAASFENSSGE